MYKRIMLFIVTILMVISMIIISLKSTEDVKINKEQMKSTLKEINNMCNSAYENVDEGEKMYLELFDKEDDFLKRGMYASTLAQVYAIKGDGNKVASYSEIAADNYMKVEGGVYYAVAEYKYLAWLMYASKRYSDGFKAAQKVLDLLSLDEENIFTEEEIIETETVVNSIFLLIYSEFGILDRAEVYYNKLVNVEMTEELEFTQGEKIASSKMGYAYSIEDYELAKKYAEEIYEISLKNDKLKNINTSDAILMDVAKANIKVGNLDEAFEQLKVSEKRILEMKAYQSLGNLYLMYAEYYEAVGNYDEVPIYYDKAIEIYEWLDIKIMIRDVYKEIIKFYEEHNRKEEVKKYYKDIYELEKEIGGDELIKNVFRESSKINDTFYSNRLEHIDQKNKQKKIITYFFIGAISILSFVILKIGMLIKKANENRGKLQEVINKDYLTDTYTRGYGYEYINNLINCNKEFSIAVLDIDNFKHINDKHGHMYGDKVLKHTAKLIKNSISFEDKVIRLGGEEFLIVFLNKDNESSKIILGETKLKLNKEEFIDNINLSFSAGICKWNGENIDSLIKDADKLMYKAKNEGKNRIYI